MLTTEEKAVLDAGREVLSPSQSEIVVSFQYALTKYLVDYATDGRASIRNESHFQSFRANHDEMIREFATELGDFDCLADNHVFRTRCFGIAAAIGVALETGRIPVVTSTSFSRGSIEYATDVLRKAYPHCQNVPLRAPRHQPTVVVYGPPGVGKSTTLAAATESPELLIRDAGNHFTLTHSGSQGFFVAPTFVPFCVLLMPPLADYFQRMEKRNAMQPDKRGQLEMRSYAKWNGRREWFDLVVSDPDVSPSRLVAMFEVKLKDNTSNH
jgi:hypothetical protein